MKGYRTLVFNALRAIMDSGIFAALLLVDWETAGFSPQVAVWILFAISMFDKALNIFLRFKTTTPVGGVNKSE